MENIDPRIVNTFEKKNKVEGIIPSNLKTLYTATVIKIVWHWRRERCIGQ